MDYLYLNAIVKEVYKDLPCGRPFPSEFGKSLYSAVSGLDCLSNPEVPNVLSFFTLRDKEASTIVFSKIQKHTNSASVGRFIQSVGWTWDGDKLLHDLDSFFNVDFYSEAEINNTAMNPAARFELPKNRPNSYEKIAITLSPRVKQAILTTVLLRWMRMDAPLRIAVPKNVDYNSYVISAMQEIYKFFPVSLRARAGFCSYLPSDKNLTETISIGFVPEKMADSRTLCLDDSSPATCALLIKENNNENLGAFIRHIANSTEDALKAEGFFEGIYEDLEGSGSNAEIVKVLPRHYQAIGSVLSLMNLEGSLPEQIAQWNRGFFGHKDRESIPLRWQNALRKKIRETIDPAEFCRLAERQLARKSFEGLKDYQEYCEGNPRLASALWETTVALQVNQKTYKELYTAAARQQKDLSFILDSAKLDQLFLLSVDQELKTLRAKPAQDMKAIKNLAAEANELLQYANSREVPAGAGQKQAVADFFGELKDKENRLLLDLMHQGFLERRGQSYRDDPEKTQALLNEMVSYRQRVAAKASVPGTAQLLADIDAFMDGLKDHQNDLIHAALLQRYNKLTELPANTLAQIQQVVDTAKALLADVKAAAPTRKNAELLSGLQRFIAEKEAEGNSSNVKFQEINRILNNLDLPYFAVLEALDKADKSQLEDSHRSAICEKLAQRRPDSLESYERNFERYYRRPLILSNVAVLPDYVSGIIARDLCQLDQISLTCGNGNTAAENAQRIIRALAIAGKLSDNHTVVVNYDGTNINDPVWFKNLLLLTHDTATMGDKAHLEKVICSLARKDAFSGNEMVPALAMLIRCNLDPSILLSTIFRGHFQGATEQQYRQAFEMLLQSGKLSPKDALAAMVKSAEKVKANMAPAAGKAFRKFCKDHETKSGGNKLMIPLLCAMGVLIVALIATVMVLILKDKEPDGPTTEPTTVATVPVETEAPVVYPEEFKSYTRDLAGIKLLYANNYASDFSAFSAKVSKLLDGANKETAELIIGSYTNNHGAPISIDDQDTTVTWDEYFFWLCWYYADRDVTEFQEILKQNNYDEAPVLSILQTIHNNLPEEAKTPEPAATEATEATETATEATTEAANETATETATEDTTEPVTEPTETAPPVTVSSVKDVITEAAKANYEPVQPVTERMGLVWKLFGEDFQLNFDEHINKVTALNIIEDAKNTSYASLAKHYNTLSGDTLISFSEDGLEVTWNEYVFWECWVLAQKGATAIDDAAFTSDLRKDTVNVLSVIHQFIDEDAYNEHLAAAAEAAEKALSDAAEVPQSEDAADAADPEAESGAEDASGAQDTTANAEETDAPEIPALLADIIEGAKASFKQMQLVYHYIFQQVNAQ